MSPAIHAAAHWKVIDCFFCSVLFFIFYRHLLEMSIERGVFLCADHGSRHHSWMQVSGNRLDRSKTAPSYEKEVETQALWANDPKSRASVKRSSPILLGCVFLIMDVDAGADVSISEMGACLRP